MKKVTLAMIAKELGLSRSAVCCALQNRPRISIEMRRKVQQTAARLGWVPNAELTRHMALVRASARTQELPNLAIIINRTPRGLAEEACPRLQLAGASDRARQLGYHADIFNLAESPLSAPRLTKILSARGVRGVTFIATTGLNQLPEEILKVGRNFATAIAGVTFDDPPFHTAINDVFMAGRTGLLEMARLGFKRIGSVLPEGLDLMLQRQFYGGIQSGAFDLPAASRLPVCYVGKGLNYIPASDFPVIHDWLVREQPDALLTTDVRYLTQCLASAEKRFRRVPIFSLDWAADQPAAGGIDGRPREVGAAAVDLTIAQINRGESGVPAIQKVVTIEVGWKLRPSFAKKHRR